MLSVVLALGLLVLFFLLELLYFKIADRYNIIDKPNSRSSHTDITIRGGGILFPVGALIFSILNEFEYPYFIAGLGLIALVSFLDDILTLNNKGRVLVHVVSALLLLWQWELFSMPLYVLAVTGIGVIGIINAYNFMDGINGITGVYSLVSVVTLFFINREVSHFVDPDLLINIGLTVLVFNYFNFRTKARCFAGDVGSVSIAFILIFFIGALIIQTQNFVYILLLLVYGLDAVTTIGFRLVREENIFEAHRSHFYQYLANEKKISQLCISAGYGMIQLLFNILVVKLAPISIVYIVLIIVIAACLFIGIRFTLEGKERLLKKTST